MDSLENAAQYDQMLLLCKLVGYKRHERWPDVWIAPPSFPENRIGLPVPTLDFMHLAETKLIINNTYASMKYEDYLSMATNGRAWRAHAFQRLACIVKALELSV